MSMNYEGELMKKILLIMIFILMFSLSGCSKGIEYSAERNLDMEGAAVESRGAYVPGTYVAEERGYGGDVKVTMTFDEGFITCISVTGENETKSVGTKAIDQIPDLILENQSSNVDAVSKATVTSMAIKAAAGKCIKEATAS